MSTFFWTLISYFIRILLSLRYRIRVKGLEKLNSQELYFKGGILFMPNHSAHMDPFLNFLILWSKYRMRPLVIEYVFKMPLMKFLHQLVKSIPIPNFETAVNEYKVHLAENSIREIAEGLKRRENFIVYPSGRLKSTGKELLAGASGVHEILKECKDVNVVLIRTTGFWGSSFSQALEGKSPDLSQMLLHGVKVVLKNLIFFTPRREILIEIEPNPRDFPRKNSSRIELNRYLENWYNCYPDGKGNVLQSEPVSLISYSFWEKELPKMYERRKKDNEVEEVEISKSTRLKVYKAIRRILEDPNLKVEPEMNLAFDLGMDSLNIAELITFLTKHFDIGRVHPEDLETVGSVLLLAEQRAAHKEPKQPLSNYHWPDELDRLAPTLPMGRTVPEAFLNSCQRLKNFAAVGDDMSGVLSYKRLKRAVLILSQYFKTFQEEHIAIMLPASVGAYLAILAVQMAGKIPVMLNWTLGSRYLEEMMKISEAKVIITSWKFLDRLYNVQFGTCLNQLLLLEEIRAKLTLKMKLKGLFLSTCSVKCGLRLMGLNEIDEKSPCVILFTSGTEAAPKGVPLTHRNVISNQRSGMQAIEIYSSDVVYGILPPFHSFGFSVAGLFPILGGIRVAFYPDPTDSFALAEGIERWKIGIFCSAPSFLKGLFYAARDEQLQTIRYFVSGAEKASDELYERVEKLNSKAKLLEGYGITECSPILTLRHPNFPTKGVGKLLPDVDLITIHPETEAVLKPGEDGEICVRGPNIFEGYLGGLRDPFIEIENQRWYRTGDLGHLDEMGNLILSGRLKRFTKIGGEMISLGGIEEVLIKHFIEKNQIDSNVVAIAICADERDEGKPQLILFTILDLEKEEANQILQDAGFSNLVKISAVKKIEEIPLMGAGKTDYRNLQDQC